MNESQPGREYKVDGSHLRWAELLLLITFLVGTGGWLYVGLFVWNLSIGEIFPLSIEGGIFFITALTLGLLLSFLMLEILDSLLRIPSKKSNIDDETD